MAATVWFCFQHPGGPHCAAAHRICTAVAGVENGLLWECSEVPFLMVTYTQDLPISFLLLFFHSDISICPQAVSLFFTFH